MEVIGKYFKKLSNNIPGGIEEKYKNLCSGKLSESQELNTGLPNTKQDLYQLNCKIQQ
jgi:hypothetical protein